MSVRIKTEDGDLIVSGKGKDGKDGGGEIAWFLVDKEHSITWDNKRNDGFVATGTYYTGSTHYIIYCMTVGEDYVTFYSHEAGKTTGSSPMIRKMYYVSASDTGIIVGIPKYVVEECNIKQITK